MKWNLDKIIFLYQPDVFLGSFDSPQMQSRHEQELEEKLVRMKGALAEEADPLKAMYILNHRDHIQFLTNNIDEFRHCGKFEEAVLFLYGKENAPFSSGGDAALWEKLFNLCDKIGLRKCGKPLFPDTTTAYRGSVTGFRRSLAWTPDIKRARRFAERWKDTSQGGGEIYEVDIRKDAVLVYMSGRSEDVIILSPDFIKTAEIRPFSG